MKMYLVGGAVRDKRLGLPVKERDWVVVGATVNDMIALGFKQVGKDFPVFLHPKTREEYALARMERKTRPGYQGFSFDTSPAVTLEDDLLRRDLTINAMAESENGELIDPYHGEADLKAKVLRHVSDAFAEDPVRILRVGRFYARYAHLGFTIADETIALMKQMVTTGEIDALVAERVWKELERALEESNPECFFAALDACGALPVLFPNITMASPSVNALITTAHTNPNPMIRFAALTHTLDEQALTELCQRYRVPNDYRDLAKLTAWHHALTLRAKTCTAAELAALFAKLDIYRRIDRFHDFLQACIGIAQAKKQTFDPRFLTEAAMVAKKVDVQALIAQGYDGNLLAEKLRAAREAALSAWLTS